MFGVKEHRPLSYEVWRATKTLREQEERVFVAGCIATCADEVFADVPDPFINESSIDDNNSRSHSLGSHQSHGSAVKPQAA